MARRQTEQLVDRIRLQRRRVRQAWRAAGRFDSVRRNVAAHPVPWVVGSAALGVLVLPFLASAVLHAPRRLARLYVRGAVQGGAAHLVQTGLVSLWERRQEAPRWSSPGGSSGHDLAEEAEETDGSDTHEPPLQASGGPIQPLRAL